MRAKKFMLAFFIFFLSAGITLCAGEEKSPKKEPEEKGIKSLIRKELLLREGKKLEPPRRNIFSPRNPGRVETEMDPIKSQQNAQENVAFLKEGTSRLPLNIKYIGYIVSVEKIVALIIFRGDTLAVEEGEMISQGVKIGKITLREIEIIGPDSGEKKYRLEGEKE